MEGMFKSIQKMRIVGSKPLDKKYNETSIGFIDRFVGEYVYGWAGHKEKEVYPYITANGIPCHIETYGVERLDVKDTVDIGPNVGFIAKLPSIDYANIKFELHAISMDGIQKVNEKEIFGARLVADTITKIFQAKEISQQDGAVAIAVWEGTHNPIGRAHVLYNILKERHPTIIFAYDIGFSDTGIWEPLINSDCQVVIIPWEQREFYHNLISDIGLNFDLVWVCKPRLPAFEMAKSISHKETKYIVDLDDNELEMSSSKAAEEKPYGLLSAKMAQGLMNKINARSVASTTLKRDFGGEFVRHARATQLVKRKRSQELERGVRVGFIGTVRPHKGVVQAAKAIKSLNERNNYNIKFVVGGIYDPASIRTELIDLGCEVHGKIDSARLNGHLQNLDLVITGFPDQDSNKEILKYQITSKIGDALSNERPVLVPEGPSVADLQDIAGIHLFDPLNFERKLIEAITSSDQIVMHPMFSLESNFEQFLALQNLAMTSGVSGSELFRLGNSKLKSTSASADRKNVLLVWKQHDSGLYGRRVDHLARELVANDYHVTCLEILNDDQLKRYKEQSIRIDADFNYILEDISSKRTGFFKDGIYYKSISSSVIQTSGEELKRYMLEKSLYPTNTKVVLFPAVPDWKMITNVLEGYPVLCDVVDNQLAWEKKKPLELLSQYKHLMDFSRSIIFNSEDNYRFFKDRGYLSGKDSYVIPNWYRLPIGFELKDISSSYVDECEKKKHVDIVYSGNMNDRFDWDLVARLSDEVKAPLTLHLIGNCQRVKDKMTLLLERSNITYHGPMREKALLEFMSSCDLAIMPHISDEHSGFMNPMKVNMFRKIGLPCVASDMPGVDFSNEGLMQAKDQNEFIQLVESATDKILAGQSLSVMQDQPISPEGQRYIELIQQVGGYQ